MARMDTRGGPGMNAEEPLPDQPGLERRLPDNCIEYFLFILDEAQPEARKQLSQIESIRKSALDLSNSLTKDYIWQKEEFNLELKNEQGLIFLHGTTDYSEAVEDEWLIVYILRELTKSHPGLWVRVFDTDGEFLLVEAANVLPKWLSPEIDHNRVWIHDGKLFIIPLKDEIGLSDRNLSLPIAVEAIKTKQDALVYSNFIEAEAFYRLEKYPSQITDSVHYSLTTIPRKVAHILHSLPKSVAPAVEIFYLRDAISLKRIISPSGPLTFPPEDLVTVSIKFSKVLFAQLRSQRFEAPSAWRDVFQRTQKQASSTSTERELARLDIGMKLTCGLEMLAAKAHTSKSRAVRELAIVLEDLAEDGDDALPSNEDIKAWKDTEKDDSENWMDINYEDFERELEGKRAQGEQGANSGFGDVKTQADLRKIVSRFEAFLNDDEAAGVDGVELDDMDIDDEDSEEDGEFEDEDVSFDEDEFARMMREMMGLPAAEQKTKTTTATKGQELEKPAQEELESGDEDDEEIRRLALEFEAELNQHGALKLDPAAEKKKKKKEEEKPCLKDKAESAGNFGKETAQAVHKDGEDEDDEESEEEVDIDYNLAKNLLESFKSQAGMAGPTSNILGMMGFQLPRDEDDGGDEEEKAGSSNLNQTRR